VTTTKTSALENAAVVRLIRLSESSVASSTPAVSRNTTGPIAPSSIGFSTTSAVVPGIGETIDTS